MTKINSLGSFDNSKGMDVNLAGLKSLDHRVSKPESSIRSPTSSQIEGLNYKSAFAQRMLND